jgi:hypothetical protein
VRKKDGPCKVYSGTEVVVRDGCCRAEIGQCLCPSRLYLADFTYNRGAFRLRIRPSRGASLSLFATFARRSERTFAPGHCDARDTPDAGEWRSSHAPQQTS